MNEKEQKYLEFLNKQNFDLRKIGMISPRPFDQKLTPDIIYTVAKLFAAQGMLSFKNKDIINSDAFRNEMEQEFGKPAPGKNTENEYDKVVGQPSNFFQFIGILERVSNTVYKVSNMEMLKLFTENPFQTINLLYITFKKIFSDSQFNDFEIFLNKDNANTNDYYALRDTFVYFINQNTRVKRVTEPRRIIGKILNIFSYKEKKIGSRWGRASEGVILYQDLVYTNTNARDLDKPKNISRKEFRKRESEINSDYLISKTKKAVRQLFNNKSSVSGEEGVAIHHILPISQFPEFKSSIENLIPLTYQEHMTKAHPNGNTQIVSKEYQKKLMLIREKEILNNCDIFDVNVFNKMQDKIKSA